MAVRKFVGNATQQSSPCAAVALYAQDQITKGNWSFNLGLHGDFYNGLTTHNEAEPRLGIAYNIKPSSTILRVSYAQLLETPFNENLIVSSTGCSNAVLNPLLGGEDGNFGECSANGDSRFRHDRYGIGAQRGETCVPGQSISGKTSQLESSRAAERRSEELGDFDL